MAHEGKKLVGLAALIAGIISTNRGRYYANKSTGTFNQPTDPAQPRGRLSSEADGGTRLTDQPGRGADFDNGGRRVEPARGADEQNKWRFWDDDDDDPKTGASGDWDSSISGGGMVDDDFDSFSILRGFKGLADGSVDNPSELVAASITAFILALVLASFLTRGRYSST